MLLTAFLMRVLFNINNNAVVGKENMKACCPLVFPLFWKRSPELSKPTHGYRCVMDRSILKTFLKLYYSWQNTNEDHVAFYSIPWTLSRTYSNIYSRSSTLEMRFHVPPTFSDIRSDACCCVVELVIEVRQTLVLNEMGQDVRNDMIKCVQEVHHKLTSHGIKGLDVTLVSGQSERKHSLFLIV